MFRVETKRQPEEAGGAWRRTVDPLWRTLLEASSCCSLPPLAEPVRRKVVMPAQASQLVESRTKVEGRVWDAIWAPGCIFHASAHPARVFHRINPVI